MNELIINIKHDKAKIQLILHTLEGLNNKTHLIEKVKTELQNQIETLSYMEKRIKEQI